MNCYFGSSGGSYLVMCNDNGVRDIYRFDKFGSLLSVEGLVSDCGEWFEVDVVSIIGVGSSRCEILYNDSKIIVDEPFHNVLVHLRSFGKHLGTFFNIKHSDNLGSFTQVLFVYMKNSFTKTDILGKYAGGNWIKLDSV